MELPEQQTIGPERDAFDASLRCAHMRWEGFLRSKRDRRRTARKECGDRAERQDLPPTSRPAWYPPDHEVLKVSALRAVKEGRVTLDRPIVSSATRQHKSPVKMDFARTVITSQRAKDAMVKSATRLARATKLSPARSESRRNDKQRAASAWSSRASSIQACRRHQIGRARDMTSARASSAKCRNRTILALPGLRIGTGAAKLKHAARPLSGADGMKTGFL